ncbi:MAG TPA: anti-sigma F factor antagonist [Selenomonadales bacterium]|nr:anti-sigma F factor antagonist [Selenomonadales bacterium]
MNISTLVKQGVLVIRVEGELDMHVADEFRQTVDEALAASGMKHVILNLKGVTFIDSSGLGVILGRYKKVAGSGGKMLAANVRPQVARILELSGLLRLIAPYGSETEAMESL